METEDNYDAEELHAFNCFLAGLQELGYGFAWRVLDTQYVRVDGYPYAIPQRRRRVLLVGYLGDWRRCAAVLSERESLSGYPAPGRRTGQGITGNIETRAAGGGGLDVAHTILGKHNDSHDHTLETYVPMTASLTCGDRGISPDQAAAGMIVPEVAPTLLAKGNRTGGDRPPGMCVDTATSLIPIVQPYTGANCLTQHMHKGINTTLDEGQTPVVVFDCKAAGGFMSAAGSDVAPTLRAMNGEKANGGGHLAVAVSQRGRDGGATAELGGNVSPAIRTGQGGGDKPYVIAPISWTEELTAHENLAGTLQRGGSGGRHDGVMLPNYAVRRLTPRESERLQGFPDDYTLIPWRGKPADQCPDGPRYKVLGNSMSVNVMRWVGMRIQMVDGLDLPETDLARGLA